MSMPVWKKNDAASVPKKDTSGEMASGYDPAAVEREWYEWWQDQGYFTPEDTPSNGDKKNFVMVIPPPNVTGSLHIGHALTNAIQDCLTRWRRMSGHNTLWLPGVDHAGIATQVVVEKKLMRDSKLTRHDLGREKFVEKVWEWKEEYGSRITKQLRSLGSSLDWSREVFTMDDKLSAAVQAAFVQMFDKGYVYRSTRLVNWCSTLKTAISDIEVDRITLEKKTRRTVPQHGDKTYVFGVLVDFAYPVEGTDEEIVVSTTRIETMLGDTGVAVHPDDKRYKHLHGKFVVHPFNGRRIPIITDGELVDMEFGTGCVKITPAHDFNDYECGKRNKLPMINILTEDGRINSNGGEFAGMLRFDARNAIFKALEEKGLLRGTSDNAMSLGLCSRTGDVLEPMLKPQWFVKCDDLAARAVAAVREKTLHIIPPTHESTWFHWLENIRPWCVSRQLWWGHRIPAYYATKSGEATLGSIEEEDEGRWIVAPSEAEARAKAAATLGVAEGDVVLTQDPDVLDTWFSSGLFPFSVMGWPEATGDLDHFFPGSLLETGSDILFFWVARMVMMSLALTDKLPFTDVFLHAMVRDAHGRKMSKTLGNVVDPLDVISGISLQGLQDKLKRGNLAEKEVKRAAKGMAADFPKGIAECGADALRFALIAYTTQGRDINLDINRVVGYRHFCNKLWNASRFNLLNMGDDFRPDPASLTAAGAQLSTPDKWILSRLNHTIRETNAALEKYEFGNATHAVYTFWLHDLCDYYLEMSKRIFRSGTDAEKDVTRTVLYECYHAGLRLLHPFMPFVTEELYQRLPKPVGVDDVGSIMVAPFPQCNAALVDAQLESDFKSAQEVVHALRSLRAGYGLRPANTTSAIVLARKAELAAVVRSLAADIGTLGFSDVAVIEDEAEAPQGCAVQVVNEAMNVLLSLKGVVDPAAEIKKLEKKRKKLEKAHEGLIKRRGLPSYAEKVPPHVQEKDVTKLEAQKKELEELTKAIDQFKAMQ